MKMIVAVVRDEYSSALTEQLTKKGFGATKLASTGGFLKAGNTTFLIGVPAAKLDEVLEVIKAACPATKGLKGDLTFAEGSLKGAAHHLRNLSGTVEVGGATVFVLGVEKMLKV